MSTYLNPVTKESHVEGTAGAIEAMRLWKELKALHKRKGSEFILNWLNGTATGQAWRAAKAETMPVEEKKAKQPITPRPIAEEGDVMCDADGRPVEYEVLVDIEQMHPGDVMTLKRRIDAANMRINAECTELRAGQYSRRFEPSEVLAQYGALEREIMAGKRLLLRNA